jgi:hypothetical protein
LRSLRQPEDCGREETEDELIIRTTIIEKIIYSNRKEENQTSQQRFNQFIFIQFANYQAHTFVVRLESLNL